MNWQDSTEIVAGLVLKGQYSAKLVSPNLFLSPYDAVIDLYKQGKPIEDIILEVGISPIQTAFTAASQVNGLGNTSDWRRILETSKVSYESGKRLSKLAHKLTSGKEIDWSELSDIAQRAQLLEESDCIPMASIQHNPNPFIETGWDAIDEHLGGIPKVGLVLVAGNPGSGKTTLLGKLISKFVKRYPDKTAAIFSLEMMAGELAERIRKTNSLSKDEEERIILHDKYVTSEQLINRAASIKNLGIVGIDFADLLIHGEVSESTMAYVYRMMMIGAKQLHVPFVLLAHPSRRYEGGIPRPYHIRYSGTAENFSWMIWMPYNPNNDYFAEKDANILPIMDDVAYICVWKVRGGFRKHLNDSPGAIALGFRGERGWSDNALSGNRGWWSLKSLI